MSLSAIYDLAPDANEERALLVMLPGAKATAQDFFAQGFVGEVRARGMALDIAAVDADLGHYLERTFTARLAHDIVEPALAKNTRRVWLMGISLGGGGALTYAREHPAQIEGVIVLAPFLATTGTIAEVIRAGGWPHWDAGAIDADDGERQLLAWVQAYTQGKTGTPQIYLGYGTEDRFVAASELLAQRLPPGHVVSIAGGHDWPTWSNLWRTMLERKLFIRDNPGGTLAVRH